jgi:hypothetical protein
LRFTGLPGDDTVSAKTAEVEHLLKAKNLAAAGPPLVAQYNPSAADASLYAPRRDHEPDYDLIGEVSPCLKARRQPAELPPFRLEGVSAECNREQARSGQSKSQDDQICHTVQYI